MSSLGTCEMDIWIKGKKCTHLVNVVEELSDNIISIDFIHKHHLNYNAQKWQVKFIDTPSRALRAIR